MITLKKHRKLSSQISHGFERLRNKTFQPEGVISSTSRVEYRSYCVAQTHREVNNLSEFKNILVFHYYRFIQSNTY